VKRQAMMSAAVRWRTPLAACLLLAVLFVLAITGQWPELRSKVPFTPRGLLAIPPSEIHRIEVRSGSYGVVLHRQPNGWSIDGLDEAVPADLSSHVGTALRLANVSEPARQIPASELTTDRFAEFGLDPPANIAVLETQGGVAATLNFGTLNPAGTSHYVRLGGAPTVYLMSRHVGEEWRLIFDMARRLLNQAGSSVVSRRTSLLLPVSMAQVWAVEIVFAGKLTRFERDTAGTWFRHVGQHAHSIGSDGHIADPAQARVIDAALRALDASAVETRVGAADSVRLAQYGFALPTLIVLLYGRDSSVPLARLEFGAMADDLDRYARLASDGGVVTVAEFEVRHLTELLKAVGAGS
jgi:hypothetical protein